MKKNKYTSEQIQKARDLFVSGVSSTEVSKKLNMPRSTLSGERWLGSYTKKDESKESSSLKKENKELLALTDELQGELTFSESKISALKSLLLEIVMDDNASISIEKLKQSEHAWVIHA